DSDLLEQLPKFNQRLQWFLDHRPDLTRKIASVTKTGAEQRRLFSVVNRERLAKILRRMLDEDEFLSPFGIRSLSKYHKDHPYSLTFESHEYSISYQPGESQTA